jgi:predicted phosphodiesterase
MPLLSLSQQVLPGNKNKPVSGFFQHDIPAHAYNILFSRPGDHEITVSVLSNSAIEGYFVYGPSAERLLYNTVVIPYTEGTPVHSLLTGLMPDTRYYYRFYYRENRTDDFKSGETAFFQTRRSSGKSYVFTIQADSHLDDNTSVAEYVNTLSAMAADSADFLVDLGDTWMTDKFRDNFRDALPQYIAQRYYFSRVCNRSSLFLTLGNHDGETGRVDRKNQTNEMLQWATATRKKYYANPQPAGIYSGNSEQDESGGTPENYYAWEWGDALFIVLDPFRYTKDSRDPWQRTLGEQQYKWLRNTLQQTKALYRFVFIHNLVGGADNKGLARGGAEAAAFYEWGGRNADSTDGFALHRPGWDMPVHDLLMKYNVNAVFHGHDHLYAKQEKDGIIYQLLPQPGGMQHGQVRQAGEYGYVNGTILNVPGYLRVSISPAGAVIELVTASGTNDKKIIHRYSIPPQK